MFIPSSKLMENSWAVLAIVSIVTIVFISKLLFKKHPKKNLPPGPKPWPIIGNLNLGMEHQALHALSKKYGDLMQLKFGKFPVLVVSSPEMAKQFLRVHDLYFAYRPPLASAEFTAYNCSDILYAPYGPYWKQARKICVAEVFRTNKLDFYEPIRIEERRAFLSRIHALSGKVPVTIKDHLMRYTISFTSRMVYGHKFTSEKLDEMQSYIDEWFHLNGALAIGDWIPWLSFLDLGGYVKKMKVLHKKFDTFQNYEIDQYQQNAGSRLKKDALIDVLLPMSDDPSLEVEMTKDRIKGIILDLLAGGTITSNCTAEWAVHEILKQPHIIEKAKEELDRVIGRNRWVEEADLPNLPYLDAIIMEALRMHPPTTLLPPRYATIDCTVEGYTVPKGTTVMVNAWSTGRDPKTWDEPDKFLPERFLGKELEILGNFGFLAFGSGRRGCPAHILGIKSVGVMLANLLHGFNWKLPDGAECSLEEEYGLTTHPKYPVAIIMEPTLPTPV